MSIKYNYFSNILIMNINDAEIFRITDKSFVDSKIGLLSLGNGTIFTQLLLE